MQNLQPFHTFSLPAKAKKIIEIHSIPALQQGWQDCLAEQLPVLFLGKAGKVVFVGVFDAAGFLNIGKMRIFIIYTLMAAKSGMT